MKRFLLSCSLIAVAFLGHSQIILNELYTDPSGANSEFFELYNTSTDPAGINLDCYTLVTYYYTVDKNKNVPDKSGFFVVDLPNFTLYPFQYFVGASASPFKVQGGTSYTANFNWNIPADGSGSLKKYEKSGTGYVSAEITAADKNNIFQNINKDGVKYAVFLFDKGTYVNGFLGNTSSPVVPSSITGSSSFSVTNPCGTYSLDWATVKTAEFTGAAIGGDNGYTREGDGKCGTWNKTASNGGHTPGTANPTGTTLTTSGAITTSEAILCGTRIAFKITGTTDAAALPVEVQFYYDNGIKGKLDAGDLLQRSKTLGAVGASDTFQLATDAPADQKYLLVYKTALGCYSKIVAPIAPTPLVSTQTNFCGKRVDFSISNVAGSYADYAFPISVDVFYDTHNFGVLDADEMTAVNAAPISISTAGTTTSFVIPDPTKKVLLQYTSAGVCLSQTAVPVASTTPSLTLGGGFSSATTVTYFVVNAATNPANYPITLQLFNDKNKNGVIDADENVPVASQTLATAPATNAPNTNFTATVGTGTSGAILTATTNSGCSPANARIENSFAPLPVHFKSVSATRNKEKVTIKWETATETNNRGFNVQRNDKGTWKNIAFAFSQATDGNSSSALAYQYTDLNTSKGLSQYRIQQVDLDGKATYSRICAVNAEASSRSVIVYPNPSVDGKLNLLFDDNSERNVIVSDMSGRIVKQFKGITNNELSVNLLQSGMYTIQITNLAAATITTEKVVVKK